MLSGIPEERFVTSANAPKEREAFLNFLEKNEVHYLITIQKEDSLPDKLFPDSEYGEPISDYEFVTSAHTEFLLTNIHVYRRTQSTAAGQ